MNGHFHKQTDSVPKGIFRFYLHFGWWSLPVISMGKSPISWWKEGSWRRGTAPVRTVFVEVKGGPLNQGKTDKLSFCGLDFCGLDMISKMWLTDVFLAISHHSWALPPQCRNTLPTLVSCTWQLVWWNFFALGLHFSSTDSAWWLVHNEMPPPKIERQRRPTKLGYCEWNRGHPFEYLIVI